MNVSKPQLYRGNIQQDPIICVFGECGKQTDGMDAGIIQIINYRLVCLKLKSLDQLYPEPHQNPSNFWLKRHIPGPSP